MLSPSGRRRSATTISSTSDFANSFLAVARFLPYNNTLYYGLTINPVNSEVYIADAIDYVQNGVVLRYSPDGELLDEFYVGIIPGAFCWR